MTEVNNTCDYFLDPDNPDTWNGKFGEDCQIDGKIINEEGYWNCPHQPVDGEQYCIAHLDIDKKDDEKVVDEIVGIITDSKREYDNQKQKKQFLGAQFGYFDLSDYDILGKEDCDGKIDFSHSSFKNSVDWSSIQMLSDLKLSGATFKQSASFINTHFKSVEANCVSFEGLANFGNVNFNTLTTFEEAEFSGRANFELSRFHESAFFADTQFDDDAIFQNVRFEYHAFFWDTAFDGLANFDVQEFNCDVEFSNTEFNDSALFHSFETPGDLRFDSSVFRGPVHFTNLIINEDTDFEESIFKNKAKFVGTEFNGHITFEDAEFNDVANFHRVDLTDAYFTNADLRSANFESTLLSRATLFGVDLRGARLSGAVLGDVRIDAETRFLGHPEDRTDISTNTFSEILSERYCANDPMYGCNNELSDINKAKNVYRALEELGKKAARPRLQARCFVRRQKLQKESYWEKVTDANSSVEERMIASARWGRAKTAELTLLYGESPWRIIGYSLGVIVAFGLVYPLGGWIETTTGAQSPLTYERIAQNPILLWDSIYHSAMLFATGSQYGGVKAVNFTGEFLTATEALLGPTLLALLVFVLGRRAAR